ncbi:DUF3887 domain-containing protein [Eubacterium sp. 1001713B170207_170306_E7]|uniref:DUF3887 domain-containing protein n=1 Tax=Eubacterium sp. 1001713B170207_170306_E7 TaxID=2787097 RepID=UPI00189849B0|nr:DUF3887 domain-containing protein [Eubacterium sp. 1001713B170207_170306_E7]
MMKKKMMAIGLVTLMLLTVLSACSGGSASNQELDPAFNEDTLKQEAERVIEEWNNQDFDAIAADAADNVKDKLTADVLKEAWEQTMPKLGEFSRVKQTEIAPNNKNALVVAIAEYTGGTAQFTIGFDQNMKIDNFFIK